MFLLPSPLVEISKDISHKNILYTEVQCLEQEVVNAQAAYCFLSSDGRKKRGDLSRIFVRSFQWVTFVCLLFFPFHPFINGFFHKKIICFQSTYGYYRTLCYYNINKPQQYPQVNQTYPRYLSSSISTSARRSKYNLNEQ